jgi:hypothetical protein
MSNGEPIIIKGGESITIEFYKGYFPPESETSNTHVCANRQITSLTITDDSADTTEEIPLPKSGKFTIKVYHESAG